ncbi:MAG: demethoxyubiquinone hydroxylase family protein [Planctomycetota bacterium]
MPEFPDPFSGKVPDRKLTKGELVRALRLNLAAEHEAIHLYTAHAEATDDELVARVLRDVADEEREHLGEFQKLLSILLDDEDELRGEGAEEVEGMRAELAEAHPPDDEEEEDEEAEG